MSAAAQCLMCPHGCRLSEGQAGFCRARACCDGEVRPVNYGQLTALALDPIEKKPLRHFYPGSLVLSAGSFGCNLRCGFCQNHGIAMAGADTAAPTALSPQDLAQQAAQLAGQGNIGLAYTYNEPLVGYEFVRDTAQLIRAQGQQNVLVTNGFICEAPWRELLPLLDACNIDLKAFNEPFYRKVKGDLAVVKRNIAIAVAHCHVEVTCLLIPGENDAPEQIEAMAAWLAALNPQLPLHLTRFFPRYHYRERTATAVAAVQEAACLAGRYLRHVYCGNC